MTIADMRCDHCDKKIDQGGRGYQWINASYPIFCSWACRAEEARQAAARSPFPHCDLCGQRKNSPEPENECGHQL